jgi:hypothetical protein
MRLETNGMVLGMWKSRNGWLLAALSVAALLATAAFGAATSSASPDLTSFTTAVSSTDAGAHADVSADFAFDLGVAPDSTFVRSINISLPPGVMGNPNAAAQCPLSVVGDAGTDPRVLIRNCPVDSQVGVARVEVQDSGSSGFDGAIYNVQTSADEPGRIVLAIPVAPLIFASVTSRTTTDFGLVNVTPEVDTQAPLTRVQLTLWGVPKAHERAGIPDCAIQACTGHDVTPPVPPDPVGQEAFMTNPTVCDGPKTTTLDVTFRSDPTKVFTSTSDQPTPTNCDAVPFDPSIDAQPTSTKADDATGLNVKLSVPQTTDPTVLGSSHLRKAEVTLPEGTTINPSAGDGLQGCTDAQFGFGSNDDATCPDASKVGTVDFDVPILPGHLTGDVYLGTPLSTDPQSGKMFRLFQYAKGYGLTIKIPGYAKADPVTGQLTATFGDLKTLYGEVPDGMLDGLPQVPFSDFTLKFKGGDRSLLATPRTGGTKTTTAKLTSWSGKEVTVTSSFDVTADGAGTPVANPLPAAPSFTAGTVDSLAGAFSPFTMTIKRDDGQQPLSKISIGLPPGLLGMVGSVPLCAAPEAAAGTCGEASRVGSTTVSAGAGAHPYTLPGNVYLAGPYKGAPFSLSIVVHAVAGPYDLGLVVVRAPIFVDAAKATLWVPADPLPTILDGIPLRIRSVNVTLDRSSFTFNPTSCDPMQVAAVFEGEQGGKSLASSRFQAHDCARLPFAPKMTARTKGTVKFKQGAELHVSVTQQPGEAAIKSVAVLLPKQLPSRLIPTINNACRITVFTQDYKQCPTDSYIGTATAKTPVFDQPLTGPVYIVARDNDVPQLTAKLFGQGIATGVNLDLNADIIIDAGGGRSKATFNMVPDVPISTFNIDLPSGPHSILDAPSDDLCRGPMSMDVTEIAQSGKRVDTKVPIPASGCPTFAKVKITRGPRKDGAYVKVSVKAPTAGTFTVSGKGLWASRRTVVRKGGFVVRARLTTSALAAVRKHPVTFAVKVAFQPGNAPKASTATARGTVRAPAATKRR